jgi:hypothetical protein
MTQDPTGVDRALAAAGGGPGAYKALATLLGGVSVQFIYLSQRRGYFPPERARIVADTYGIPLVDLVSARVRPLLNS